MQFSASATLPFPPATVFAGLSRPEEVIGYPLSRPVWVFVGEMVNGSKIGPRTPESPKIIEWDTAHGAPAGPRAWTEYFFVPEERMMIQTEIGAVGWEAIAPIDYFKATYKVSSASGESSVIEYTSTRCPPSQQEEERRVHKDVWIKGAQFELKVALGALQTWCEEQTHSTPPPSGTPLRRSRPTAVPTSGN